MKIAAIFAMNQIISHGFGVFLFAALVPMMRESIDVSNWHLAAIGALTQLAYLSGALLLGLFGHRVASSKLMLITGAVTTSLLFSMSLLKDPLTITVVLVMLAASAAISWGTIVEIISRCAKAQQCSTQLSTAASGTAWGYGINGLIILYVVPGLGWQSGWQLAAVLGVVVLLLTWRLLSDIQSSSIQVEKKDSQTGLSAMQLAKTVVNQRPALVACLVCVLVGFTTMPFAVWLNTYFDQLGLAADVGGYTWTTVGISGMLAGVMIGRFADSYGNSAALVFICGGFFLCLCAFIYNPSRFALLAGCGYGLMYFPVWGVLAGWIRQSYSSTVTMQISSICMVGSGLGGALGNLLAGYLRDTSGSLDVVYQTLAAAALLMFVVAIVGTRARTPQLLIETA